MGLFGGGPATVDVNSGPDTSDQQPAPSAPIFALDQLKYAGVDVQNQISPYLQMDPKIFQSSQPQYILPEGHEQGRGMFEFALGHIGCAVGGGFFVGCARGFAGELFNQDTRRLSGRAWYTRMLNATAKHGSGYAQPAGTAVFLYSAVEVCLKLARADDELNAFGAGAIAGALYRSPHGVRASAIGSAVGLLLATAWSIGHPERRQRLREIFNFN